MKMDRIVTITHPLYGECELDVDKVIAIVPMKRQLLFECAIWTLNVDDFYKVSEIWRDRHRDKN